MNHNLDKLLENEAYAEKLKDAIYVEPDDYRSIPNGSIVWYFNRLGELKWAGRFCRFYDSEVLDEKKFLMNLFRRRHMYFVPIFYHVFYKPPKAKKPRVTTSKKGQKYRKVLVNLKNI